MIEFRISIVIIASKKLFFSRFPLKICYNTPILARRLTNRTSPDNRIVMRSSEKFEAKAAGQKGSEAWFRHVENVFGRQRRHRASLGDRAGYLDRLLIQ